jgi:hypothetical protein
MQRLGHWRRISAALLMIVGLAMLVRGLNHTILRGLGWQGFLESGIVGGLVFALGLARWRYWQQR